MMLRLKCVDSDSDTMRHGILEWPDFGAGIRVECNVSDNGGVTVLEKDLLYGSKDSGWEARFGQPSYVAGTMFELSPGNASPETKFETEGKPPTSSLFEELRATSRFDVTALRDPGTGSKIYVKSEMCLLRSSGSLAKTTTESLQCPSPPPLQFDQRFLASSMGLTCDGRTASCIAIEGRGSVFATTGFTKGVHYWEVRLEQADIGSVFIGVAEKPSGTGSGSSFGCDTPPKLNRWHGWGFVNFRATYTSGAERVYGAHCHAGDTVGVLLDCDAGRVSFFFDGLKYGEHILNDLGCAFENLSPFGFNVDGNGSGGAGQGAPSGFENGRSGRYPTQGSVRPRTLWPVIGLRNHGDRVTMSSKWMTSLGIDGVVSTRNALAVDQLLHSYASAATQESSSNIFPRWFISEAFSEYRRWRTGFMARTDTRGSGPCHLSSFGLDLDLDSSPLACATASASLGLEYALLAGDHVELKRSAGRVLELTEEAVVLGAYQERLFYRIVSQKSEGGSLTEGGGRAWCWDESEVVGGLPFVKPARGLGIVLPKLDRFSCVSCGGLKVVYEGGAVLRSDLEIFDGSMNLGTISVNTVISKEDVLERRVNSCGVVRYRVRHDEFGEGWVSSRIRGGGENLIVEPVSNAKALASSELFRTARECAQVWYKDWKNAVSSKDKRDESPADLDITSVESFERALSHSVFPGLSVLQTDSVLSAALSAVSNFTRVANAVESPFQQTVAAISSALASSSDQTLSSPCHGVPGAFEAAAALFSKLGLKEMPPVKSVMARLAMLRAFNRRARYALPWYTVRPCQEGSAIFGGLGGYGTSTDRAGRSRLLISSENWVQVDSIASRLRACRGLIFTSVKREVLMSITEATSTPTPLSHDEYELPREIRTVRINRLKAARAMNASDPSTQRKYSVFAQLRNETKNWGGAALRRGYVAKGHGGQKRAFKVKLIGEGVNDYSGPYREAFTDAISEVVRVNAEGRGALGVLDPSPNNANGIGENRDLFIFSLNGRDASSMSQLTTFDESAESRLRSSFSSLIATRDEISREVEEALVFLGRITGTAYRHNIPVDLPLPLMSVWKSLTEDSVSSDEKLREIDGIAYRNLGDESAEMSPLLWWQQRMLNSFTEGLSNVLPVEVLPLFSGEELRDTLCGNPEVDVDLLKSVVEYEGFEPEDPVVGFFWDTLREFSNEERKMFLQFVWARNRLPMRASDFEAPFKLQRDTNKTKENADLALPSASTCFFSLTLPEYSSRVILRNKLLFAITNVTTMETDFQTNSAEIAEGYRAF